MRLRSPLAAVAALVLAACSSPGSAANPTIVAVFPDVQWYPACATSPIELGGDLYYPLPMGAPPVDVTRYSTRIDAIVDEGLDGGSGSVAVAHDPRRVAPPGPGDDVGTVIVYSDGMARFESESGNVAWLTREKQEYGYVC